ncbi:MAG TPA: discoidin domain-containing protein, partial [Polyangia bacterium]|nr:discoidin domain-containing protein [Polyangia bacterium]
NLTDRWTTNSGSYAGQYVQIDFTGSINLSRITLDDSQTSGGDYPGAYAVFSSSDGVNFSSTPFVTGSGTSGQTVISFQQENIRAIRIQATSTTNGGWWSIGEIETNCSL